MIIQIDTDKESPQRLRRIAEFLQQLAQGQGSSASVQTEASAEMFSMFGSSDDDDPDSATAALASQLLDDDDDGPARVTPY